MSYLQKLKNEFSEKPLPGELTELTKAPSVSFVSAPSMRFSQIATPNPAAEAIRKEVRSTAELEVVRWLEDILEDDPVIYRETLAKCRSNPDAFRFFLDYARAGTVH